MTENDELTALKAENERLLREVEEQCGWPCCDCDFDAVCGDAIPRMEKFTEARNNVIAEAQAALQRTLDKSPYPQIRGTLSAAIEIIEALKGGTS